MDKELAEQARDEHVTRIGGRVKAFWLLKNLSDGSQIWEAEDGERMLVPPSQMRQFWNWVKYLFRA